jgi:hypothetical protein
MQEFPGETESRHGGDCQLAGISGVNRRAEREGIDQERGEGDGDGGRIFTCHSFLLCDLFIYELLTTIPAQSPYKCLVLEVQCIAPPSAAALAAQIPVFRDELCEHPLDL